MNFCGYVRTLARCPGELEELGVPFCLWVDVLHGASNEFFPQGPALNVSLMPIQVVTQTPWFSLCLLQTYQEGGAVSEPTPHSVPGPLSPFVGTGFLRSACYLRLIISDPACIPSL